MAYQEFEDMPDLWQQTPFFPARRRFALCFSECVVSHLVRKVANLKLMYSNLMGKCFISVFLQLQIFHF